MKTITISDVNIYIDSQPIGIMMSGGADSTVLFYILMKHAPGPISVFSCGNGRTNYQEVEGALRVINRCMQIFDRRDVSFYGHWENHKLKENMFNMDLIIKSGIRLMYSGFTRPPPDGSIKDYDTEAAFVPEGNTEKINEVFHVDGHLYAPFANINKKKIAELYKELDIEELYSYTRSCESLTLIGGHCGKCWWCKERIWAFGKLE